MNYLNYSTDQLKQLDGYWTAREITQQPTCWLTALQHLEQQKTLHEFLHPLLAMPSLRIIFTGAGTSAFIGQCLTPIAMQALNKRVEAIATTDLVSNPHEYFQADVPTLLVSFARSGNSPESVAALEIADQLVDVCYQLAITCNDEGKLAQSCTGPGKLALLMPPETNDHSFAMTSSFSSMLLSAMYLFCPMDNTGNYLRETIAATGLLLQQQITKIATIAGKQFKRVVYLGSGPFKGLSQESALKLLELTDGKIVVGFDSPLGFRHGPKAMVDEDTLVVVFISNNPYTSQYDWDLVNELIADKEAGQVLTISTKPLENLDIDQHIVLPELADVADRFLLLPYIVCAQAYGFFSAVNMGNTPDNPSASGTINRVVQGVNIHALP